MQKSDLQDKKEYLPQLDGLKGIICFFIIFVHYCSRNPYGGIPLSFIPETFTRRGWMFVELFFMISGFLFARTNRKKTHTCTFGAYVCARLRRYYPAALFAMLADISVRIIGRAVTGSSYRLTITDIIQTLSFTTTVVFNGEPFPTVVWYIHVLFVCCLIYYFIAKCNRQSTYIAAVSAMFMCAEILYQLDLNVPFLYKIVVRGILAFALGLLICEFQDRTPEKLRRNVTFILAGISAIVFVICLGTSFERVFHDVLKGFTLLFFPTILLCALNIRPVAMILSGKVLLVLGKLSMGTFLVHVPVLNLFGIINHNKEYFPFNTLYGFAAIMTSIFLCSVLWYYLVEKKLIPLFLRFFQKEK